MKYILETNIPDAPKASISETTLNHWMWSCSYSDGSGVKSDWNPTKRGAMICAINKWRSIGRIWGPVKFKWRAAP